jgi:rare lipoprotein A
VFRVPIHAGAMLLGAIFFALGGCAHRSSAKIPKPVKIGATETGIASWYGIPYNGRPTASGEIYDMEQVSAAHRTFPFGTWLEVTDLDNGKKIDVRVNDRGPFVRHRIIDLSLGAAREIEMVGPGTARVRLKVIRPPVSTPAPVTAVSASPPSASTPVPRVSDPVKTVELFAVQAGAFSDSARAEVFADSLREKFDVVRVVPSGSLWRVLIGYALPAGEAKQLAERVRAVTGEALVVADQ